MNTHATVPTQSTQQPPVAVLPASSTLMQVSSALGAILLLIVLAGWLFRCLGFAPQAHSNRLLNLKASCQVGQRERVVVVEVDNTWLVLGVTAQQITLLHTLPAPPPDGTAAETPPADFRQIMHQVLRRTGKPR
ncbi:MULTISPECIES: flagellar biosynthetic protein FliO [unclassified Serratia (in: enterobacteria)]|uniref:flagellar biosynthetic protein FliO n=1 Tax=unclassified Serratia (in: enterobacteria) TaxID=2647522 RepID=UPI000504C0BB|nr:MULTISPECIES: flagellar biosynthetic protein FliO [unclassified Serratia (in: enterobacteria)]KFK93470.1 flagellar assembly protein FliO [Serratia sp. Ag1]KFK93565.1 flagellar assembly protein FliO [Serratia sp. Ag2]